MLYYLCTLCHYYVFKSKEKCYSIYDRKLNNYNIGKGNCEYISEQCTCEDGRSFFLTKKV